MIEENKTPAESGEPNTASGSNQIKSDYSILEFGKNLVRTSQKKIEEKNVVILGDKSSGKSALFNSILLSKSAGGDSYTPTCGINYSYMRYQPNTNKKLILNIFEIGGGIKNLNLLKTLVNERNIKNTVFLLSVDFSQPSKILKSIKDYMGGLNGIIKEILDQDTILEMMEHKKSKYRETRDSNELKKISIFPLEVIIVGNKYDKLEKIDVEKIKWTCRSLRYFAHVNSLSLIYFKTEDSKLAKILNGLITTLAFGGGTADSSGVLNYSQKNDLLPLYVLYGSDSFIEIGDPKAMGTRELGGLWEDTFYSIFPDNSNDAFSFGDESEKDMEIFEKSLWEKYKEPRIDEEVQLFERRNDNPLLNSNLNANQSTAKKGKSKKVVK